MTNYLDFAAPEGLRTRGTALVVPGRGETPATYRRFGSRIAADAYQVRIISPPPPAVSATVALRQLSNALSAALSGLDGDVVRPLVLVGTDVAAATLAALAAQAKSQRESIWSERNLLSHPDQLDPAMEMVFKIETAANQTCGEPSSFDVALQLIERKLRAMQEGAPE